MFSDAPKERRGARARKKIQREFEMELEKRKYRLTEQEKETDNKVFERRRKTAETKDKKGRKQS